jgi:hypothetical protein
MNVPTKFHSFLNVHSSVCSIITSICSQGRSSSRSNKPETTLRLPDNLYHRTLTKLNIFGLNVLINVLITSLREFTGCTPLCSEKTGNCGAFVS